jgi:hypothetical protein
MPGETDLARLLAALDPRLDDRSWDFVDVGRATSTLPDGAFALIREAEGVTLIAPGAGWARISLGIASSLDAVGLTARIATALAARGISANMVAAFHHDHLFVPWDRRAEAMAILTQLMET